MSCPVAQVHGTGAGDAAIRDLDPHPAHLLPHTPPSKKKGELFPFVRAFGLLRDPSFAVFFGISLVITIALAFYYNFTGTFLKDIGVASLR